MYRHNKPDGGVSLLIKKSIKYTEIPEISVITDIYESVFVELEICAKHTIVGCLYIPPNSNVSQFNDEICCLMKKLNTLNKKVYILGDFNINLLNNNSHSDTTEFVNVMFSSTFFPLINRPTKLRIQRQL
jgi:exonuclease III